jgi:periplasmic protein TonB
MIASACRTSSFARYRFALLRSTTALPVSDYPASRISPPNALRRDVFEKRPLCAIAPITLIVLGLHGLLAIEVLRAFESKAPLSEPTALDIQLNAFAPPRPTASAAPALSPPPGRSAARAAQTPSALQLAHRSAAAPVQRAPSPAVKQASQSAQGPAIAKPGVIDRTPAPSLSQTAPERNAGAAPAGTTPPANVPETENTATQPVTVPSFNAAYLHNPPPAYPAIAQQRAWEGTVLLKVHVLASGKPDQIEIITSSGHPPLDGAAKEAVADWSFIPAKRAAQAVDGWVQVPIEFKLGT